MSKIGDYIIENGLEHDYEGEPEGCWCVECKEPCTLTEETFDYPGTHCTHGRSGTHHTGVYVSDCCGTSYTYEKPGEDDE